MISSNHHDLNKRVEKSVKRRRRFERNFRLAGLGSVSIALLFLLTMLVQICSDGVGAFKQTYIYLEVTFEPKVLGMFDPTNEEQLAIADFDGVIKQGLVTRFSGVANDIDKRALVNLISVTASFDLRDTLIDNPRLMRKKIGLWLLADDDVDIYYKSMDSKASYKDRLSDKKIDLIKELHSSGDIKTRFNSLFFSSGDSAEPEAAGVLGALKGSILTLLITLILSFPIGVASAIYLEEYAPRNKLTDFVEVNINNLAAVPSIIFGLLGLAVFINWFGLPRSVPLVGGMVLSLMTLPTVIISSRAAIKTVPQSIRDAALSMGASKMQVVLHHVLPLAMPGMLTGSIIGLAQALGETAPLLMIGMVAFIVDIPSGVLDPASALPVQIFLWADAPERAFFERSSAAIMVLLALLLTMNAFALWLRKRLQRRL